MMATTTVLSRWILIMVSPLLLLLVCCTFLPSQYHLVVVAASTISTPTSTVSSSFSSTAATAIDRLDLSYLHRCEAGDLAMAIRGTLQQQKEQRTTMKDDDNDNDTAIAAAAAEPDVVVDIDLTASLIGKNVSEILSSMKEPQAAQSTSLSSSSTIVRLTARRNRWSPKEATAILDFVLENGPTNETITKENENENENETNTTGDDDQNEDENDDSSIIEREVVPTIEETETVADVDDIMNIPCGNVTGNVTADTIANLSASEDSDDNNDDNEEETTTTDVKTTHTIQKLSPAFVSIQSLDLGWNNLGRSRSSAVGGGGGRSSGGAGGAVNVRTMNKALRRLLSNRRQCPPTIRLDVCGLGPSACRDVAMGIVERYQNQPQGNSDEKEGENKILPPPLSLDLARNEGIGDAGVAALAAAIRTVASQQHRKDDSINSNSNNKGKKKRRRKRSKKQQKEEEKNDEEDKEDDADFESEIQVESTEQDDVAAATTTTTTIFERLDLSGCCIGDVGAKALAIALKNHPLCVKHLDLSNNQISDEGAAALARALGVETDEGNNDDGPRTSTSGLVETLDLSYNKDLGDRAAKELARAFQGDGISNLILRSCNIRADGAACFGDALRDVGSRGRALSTLIGQSRSIDLSGNPLGILSKKKKSGSKYSATALRSKATDTTKAYMNIIGKSFQKGLNSINGAIGEGEGPDTLESDDEEEDRMGGNEEEDDSRKKCGALSLAEAFIKNGDRDDGEKEESETETAVHVELGLRHCSFDTKAAEALAAVLQESRQNYPRMKLTMDMTMNHVLEEDIIAALHGEGGYDDQLADMAEVYLDSLEVMREARERALKAARMAAARAKAQAERESAWGAPPPGPRYNNDYGGGDHDGGGWSDDDNDEQWDDSVTDDSNNISEEDYSDDNW